MCSRVFFWPLLGTSREGHPEGLTPASQGFSPPLHLQLCEMQAEDSLGPVLPVTLGAFPCISCWQDGDGLANFSSQEDCCVPSK